MRKAKWPGEWKVVCEVCGFQFPSSDIRRRWDGVLCCPKDYEHRHPQDLIKIRGERAVPAFVSAEPATDTFIVVCDIVGQSCYAGLATSGCAKSGNRQFTAAFLQDFYKNGHT